MCYPFSALLTVDRELLWKIGVDHHSVLFSEFQVMHRLQDSAPFREPNFIRIEITPRRGDIGYLYPEDRWNTVDPSPRTLAQMGHYQQLLYQESVPRIRQGHEAWIRESYGFVNIQRLQERPRWTAMPYSDSPFEIRVCARKILHHWNPAVAELGSFRDKHLGIHFYKSLLRYAGFMTLFWDKWRETFSELLDNSLSPTSHTATFHELFFFGLALPGCPEEKRIEDEYPALFSIALLLKYVIEKGLWKNVAQAVSRKMQRTRRFQVMPNKQTW